MSNRRKPKNQRGSTLPEGVQFIDTSTKAGIDALIAHNMTKLVEGLKDLMGRVPTEDEVQTYINGSDEVRAAVLRRGKEQRDEAN